MSRREQASLKPLQDLFAACKNGAGIPWQDPVLIDSCNSCQQNFKAILAL